MHETPRTLTGSCLCGAVQYRVTTPTLWCAHCHCTMCQRANGAAFVTWVGAAADRATFDDLRLRWHASSARAERGFCADCGTPLFFRSERWPGELHVVRASFHGEIDRSPEAHVFYDTHVDWVELGDSLPKSTSP